jgi:ariadne-1
MVFIKIPFNSDLEKAVEDLSELLESPIEPETIPDLRSKITNKTVNTF